MTSAGAALGRSFLLAALAALVVGTGCAAGDAAMDYDGDRACVSDDDCGGDQVCFADGCGDPGDRLAIEVTPGGSKGLHAQDFPIATVDGNLNLEMFGPSTFQGELFEAAPDGGMSRPYAGGVSFRVSGESAIIPGQVRRFEGTLMPENGAYSLPVATGLYTVVATPADGRTPPMVIPQQQVGPGEARTLDVVFPAPEEHLVLKGQLVVEGKVGAPTPPTLLPASVEIDVQALHPTTGHPLSQRAAVSTEDGSFELLVSPEAQKLSGFQIRAVPRNPQGLVPEKTFNVSDESLPVLYELGSFGPPREVTGRLLGLDGQPVPNARVYAEGRVNGGGTYRSASATTAADGSFTLLTLASAPESVSALYAVPPPESPAGLLETRIRVGDEAVAQKLGELVAPDKIPVEGTLAGPEGAPAGGVRVVAMPIEAASTTRPLPVGAETVTESDGRFSLRVDPALYRLDFLPGGTLPRVSRFLNVQLKPGAAGIGAQTVMATPYALSRGRTIHGKVTALQDRYAIAPANAPYALVRFFRVVSVEGRQSAILLAEGVADASGQYEVIVPTK